MPSIIPILLDVGKKTAEITFGVFSQFLGLRCEIFYCQNNESPFDDFDNIQEYNALADVDDNFIVAGIFGDSYKSDRTLDPFLETEKLIYTEDLYIPKDTKIIVHLTDLSTLVFLVKDDFAFSGNDEPLFYKHKLVPYAG